MYYPILTEPERIARLDPPVKGRISMVLDTDTYNEIDDQFAVVYSLLSPERLDVEALYAAPFHNSRSGGPADGMEKSYEEILRLLLRLGVSHEGFVYRGSAGYLPDGASPVESDAARDLVKRAKGRKEPLYVVAIGAITNVASAILMDPEIIGNIVVVWLGGHAHYWEHTVEFNLKQDIPAARVIFDSGVPVVQIPCMPVASHLLTTVQELEAHLGGKNEISDYLVSIFKGYHEDHYAWAKEIWDISTIGYLVNPSWVPTRLAHSPVLTDTGTWSRDERRHLLRVAGSLNRNAIFRDMFEKIAEAE